MEHKAVEAGVLTDKRGNVVEMEPGLCLWCGEYVEEGRDLAGATRPFDPCWNADGDFGCNDAPDAGDDGCGDHARPYDLALRVLGYGPNGCSRVAA